MEFTETTRQVLQAVQRIDPSRMVFDSLSELRLLAQSSLRYRRQILVLAKVRKRVYSVVRSRFSAAICAPAVH